MPGAIAVRSGLAITGNCAIDDARIDPAAGGITNTQTVDDTGAEAFHHGVGVAHQPQEDFHAFAFFQIEAQCTLVAVDRGEHRCGFPRLGAERARVVARAGIFDLDHVGAQIREMQRANRPGQKPGQVENANAGQRFGAH